MDKEFWSEKYRKNETAWDIGEASEPLKKYFENLKISKTSKILIPGCGNGYEAGLLNELGFTNVFVMDIAEEPIASFIQRFPDFPKSHVLLEDFFDHKEQYDLIIEQTFFCALNPVMRSKYVEKMHDLLLPNGQLAGLMFGVDFNAGPPFGGTEEEYITLFQVKFDDVTIEKCYNSIKPRRGTELFIRIKKN